MTPEVHQLRATLGGLRAGVLKKLAGLSDDARRGTVDSATNLAGLIQHLTFVESLWFEEIVAGRMASRGDRSMQVSPSVLSLASCQAEGFAPLRVRRDSTRRDRPTRQGRTENDT
jgi:Protein of unknown function (DUF664)